MKAHNTATFAGFGKPGDPPFQLVAFDARKRARLIREGVPAAAADTASRLPLGEGEVTIPVRALNKILASSRLDAAQLAATLNS